MDTVVKQLFDAHPDSLVAVVKQDCPTCALIEPVLRQLDTDDLPLTVITQDDPTFPANIGHVLYDDTLEYSWHLTVETVPTLIRVRQGVEIERTFGWVREDWERISGVETLAPDLPGYRPGCGSKSVEPGITEQLAAQFGAAHLAARRIELGELEDEIEACYDRGWSDGLPVVPPTPARVLRMLEGTQRDPKESIGKMPPNLVDCTVEKVAINAVMAGCKPEYMPVVLTVIEAALQHEFCLHGLLATTYFSGPMVIVSGPMAEAIGMNSGGNALGQGNRANATIGRTLQLIVRNVGGGIPGGVDRATLGNPGKYTFCFAENRADTQWTSLAEDYGVTEGGSTVTLFAADGVQGVVDQKSRSAISLINTFATSLRAVMHPKLVMGSDAFLVVSPEHSAVLERDGFSKADLLNALLERLQLPYLDLLQGADGIDEGVPDFLAGTPDRDTRKIPKFRPGGLKIVRAGGNAGLFSAIIAGWGASGETGSTPVTREITS